MLNPLSEFGEPRGSCVRKQFSPLLVPSDLTLAHVISEPMKLSPASPHPQSSWSWSESWPSLIVFLMLVVGGGLTIGALTGPDTWFVQLKKPSFNPPNWVFGPVWTVLYVLIAVAAWRVWTRRNQLGPSPVALWGAQLVANFLWTPIFFAAHRIDLALVVIGALLVSIVAFIVATARRERPAAALFVPYGAWVAFATVLNASLLSLNTK